MSRRTLFTSTLALLAYASQLRSNWAKGDPRLEKLYSQFMAPCCWAETLLVHSSPVADHMRGEIQQWVAEGKTDDQITAIFIGRYTIRILSMPQGARLEWLFWTPIAAMAAGFVGVIFVIRHLRESAGTAMAGTEMEFPELDPAEDSTPQEK